MREDSMMRLYLQDSIILKLQDQKQNVDLEVKVDDEVFSDLNLHRLKDLC